MAKSKKDWARKARQEKYKCIYLGTGEQVLQIHSKSWWSEYFKFNDLTSVWHPYTKENYWVFLLKEKPYPGVPHQRHQRCEFELVKCSTP